MIKNYTTTSTQTFDKIDKILLTHGAKRIMKDYDAQGRPEALMFFLKIGDREIPFKLPARVANVEKLFLASKKTKYDWQRPKELTKEQKEQAYRTAWANIRDWLDAQMALIDTEQVKLEEVFLPYAVGRDGRTYFEHAQENQYLLGNPQG